MLRSTKQKEQQIVVRLQYFQALQHVLRLSLFISISFGVFGCGGINARKIINDETLKKETKGKPLYLHGIVRDELEEGERNKVLNWNRIAIKAFREGDRKIAEEYFDKSIVEINRIFGNDERAKKARSLWFSEETKKYKGDPYERAMVFFYRGLLYYLSGSLDNARAAFRSGQIQDAFAEENQFKSDFAIFEYLEGRITQRIDSPAAAEEAIERFKTLRPKIRTPSEKDNLLIISTVNSGPLKYANPDDPNPDERIKVRIRTRGEPINVVMVFNQNKLRGVFSKIESLNYQATTRGGRVFDNIMKGKVEFKENTDTAGNVALGAGLAITEASNTISDPDAKGAAALLGLGVMAVGGIFKIVSKLTEIGIDTRVWKSLPGHIHVWSRRVSPGKYPLEIRYYMNTISKDSEILSLYKKKQVNTDRFLELLEKHERKELRKDISIQIDPNKKDNMVFIPSPNM